MSHHYATGITPHGTCLIELHPPDTDAGRAQVEKVTEVITQKMLADLDKPLDETPLEDVSRAVLDALSGDR